MARHAVRRPGTFEERCLAQADKKEADASRLAPGIERDDLMRDARQMRIVVNFDRWLSSPGLKAPT